MADNQRKPISFEGKITIFLALVGLGGVGFLQVLPHPYNDYVGWTLIWTAIVGIVALGVYHVATTVESPRFDPKPRSSRMTGTDAGFLVAIVATAASLIALGLRHRSVAAIVALIACVAVAFDFGDRHWLEKAPPAQIPLGPDSALMEIRQWQFGALQNARQYGANLFTINRGKEDAIGFRSFGLLLISSAVLPDAAIAPYYPMIKAIISSNEPPPSGQIHPGQNEVWFSAISGELTDAQLTAINTGSQIPYALSVMQYKDKLIPGNKFIYTESCAYRLPNGAIANCHRGTNVSYISD